MAAQSTNQLRASRPRSRSCLLTRACLCRRVLLAIGTPGRRQPRLRGLGLRRGRRPSADLPGLGRNGRGEHGRLGLAFTQLTRPVLVVLDNERRGKTGNQPTHTASGVSLAGVARECGLPRVIELSSVNGVPALAAATRETAGPRFAVFKTAIDKPAPVMPPRDGSCLKTAFARCCRAPRRSPHEYRAPRRGDRHPSSPSVCSQSAVMRASRTTPVQ